MLSRKCAIDKVQGLNLEEGVVNFRLQKQSTFGWTIKWMFPLCKKMNDFVELVFSKIFRRYLSQMLLSQLYYWMLGHSKNMHKGDSRLMSNDAVNFTEAQLQHQQMVLRNILKTLGLSLATVTTSFLDLLKASRKT